MKLTVDARPLAEALAWVSAAIPNRPTSPVLAGALLNATEDGLTISGHDWDNALRAEVKGALVGEPGTVLAPGRALAAIVAKLKGEVTLHYTGATLNVTAGRNAYRLGTIPVDEYPNLDSWFATDTTATVDAGWLRSTFEKVQHAASTDSTLPVLTGVQLTSDGQELSMACTDRYRLGIATARFTGGEFSSALVPAKVFAAVLKTLNGQVGFGTSDTILTVADATHTAAMRLLDAQFPVVSALQASHGTVTWRAGFNATAMREALARLLALDDGRVIAHPVQLEIDAEEIRITTHADMSHQGAEYVTCELELNEGHGLPIRLQMNPEYLTDGINAHNMEEVWLGSRKPPTTPVVIGGNPGLFEMTMPQRAAG